MIGRSESSKHPLRDIVYRNKNGEPVGIFSVCSANEFVIRASLIHARRHGYDLLIESTSNQVNQLGGYTGMTPDDFAGWVTRLAQAEDYDRDRLMLGGDHLGPIVFCDMPEDAAMEGAADMVRSYVLAGYTKIHIDTSMRLGDDDSSAPLTAEVIARRSAYIAKVVMQSYEELKMTRPDAQRPVLIVGSEVPIPGGSQSHEDRVTPTDADDFCRSVEAFCDAYEKAGASFDDVIAFVVQPGVEFGDDFVFQYNRENAEELVSALKKFDSIVFEGHSTDYQTKASLTRLVDDGVAILKVGPNMTFAFREALFLLEEIERIVAGRNERSDFKNTLMSVMNGSDKHWRRYYRGTREEIEYKKMYSYSDRCRYYLPQKAVADSIGRLISNLPNIPPALLSQYFPHGYAAFMNGEQAADALSLIYGRIGCVLDHYSSACGLL